MIVAVDANLLCQSLYHIHPDPPDAVKRLLNRLCFLREWAEGIALQFACDNLRCIAAFDAVKGKNFRRSIRKDYKLNRSHEPAAYEAVAHARDAISNANEWELAVAAETFEADDMIASIAASTDEQVVIHSSDKDLNQCLVDGRVGIIKRSSIELIENGNGIPVGNEFTYSKYTARDLVRQFGFQPDRWVDYQCLVGDQADNVKGAEGIGHQSAMRIVREFDDPFEELSPEQIGLNRRQLAGWPDFIERLPDLRDIFSLRTEIWRN